MKYLLASQGVFRTIQGEGCLVGEPMTFVRFAGCSVGCPECDTDYKAIERIDCEELVKRIVNTAKKSEWIWLTGGEPTDQNLDPLINSLVDLGYNVAIATSGIRKVNRRIAWISVSPHSTEIVQVSGHELKIVPGLNGFKLSDIEKMPTLHFAYKYVQPLTGVSSKECIRFVLNNPGWRLSGQSHKIWGIL